jgi:hypothetical protein
MYKKVTSQMLLKCMRLGVLGGSDTGRPPIQKLHDEDHSEAHNEKNHNAIEEQAGHEEDDAQADEALEEPLPIDAIRVRLVHCFLVPVMLLHSSIHDG